jgi:DNA-directed RNA polymerase specialized sigma24 family protein
VDLGAAVGRAQQGDAEAFRLLYRDIQPRLLRYLHALAGQDAEDIASETWLQVTRDLPGFAGTYDGFRGWVATIARHRALDHLRKSAQVLGKRPGAIRTAAHRGLKTLHKKLDRAKEPPPADVARPAGVAQPAGVTQPARVTQTRGLTLKDVR